MEWRRSGGFLLLGLIWGSEWLGSRQTILPPLQAMGFRYAVAALLLGCVCLLARPRRLRGEELMASALIGVAALAAAPMLTIWAAGRISPGLLVVLLSLTPLIAALMEGRAAGGFLAFLVGGTGGTSLVAAQGLSFAWEQWSGGTAVLGAAVIVAGTAVYWKRSLSSAPVAMTTAVQVAAAAVAVAGASLITEKFAPIPVAPGELLLVLCRGMLGSGVAYLLYYSLLRDRQSFQMVAIQWVVTLVSIAEGLVFVGEGPSWRMLAGLGVLALSLVALWRAGPEDDRALTIEITGARPAPLPRDWVG